MLGWNLLGLSILLLLLRLLSRKNLRIILVIERLLWLPIVVLVRILQRRRILRVELAIVEPHHLIIMH